MQQLDLFGAKEEKPGEKKQDEVVVKKAETKTDAEENTVDERKEEVVFKKEEAENVVEENIETIVEQEFETKIEVEEKSIAAKKIFKEKKIEQKSKRGRKSFKEMDAEVDLINVPADDILFQKQYYGIGEVAEWFNVNASLIRFWENEFTILKPRKTKKGDRLFRPEDVKNIELIYHLLRQRKFSMEGAKKYLEANREHADTNKILIQSLTKLRNFLAELKTNLEA